VPEKIGEKPARKKLDKLFGPCYTPPVMITLDRGQLKALIKITHRLYYHPDPSTVSFFKIFGNVDIDTCCAWN